MDIYSDKFYPSQTKIVGSTGKISLTHLSKVISVTALTLTTPTIAEPRYVEIRTKFHPTAHQI
jgi:hypothetical protein